MDRAEANKQKKRAALLSIGSNVILTSSKIAAGVITGSVSIISEGIHSGMDLLASMIAYFSIRISSMPPDNKHSFGHGKFEDASGIIEAMLIVAAAGIIIWEAVRKLITGNIAQNNDMLFIGMIVMAVSALMNLFVSMRLIKVARATGSIALESDGMHLGSDVLTSAGVLAGLAVIQVTHLTFLDSVIAVIVALIILKKAYSLIRRAFGDLMDESLSEEEVEKITEIIERHENEYINFHHLKTRKAGPDKFAEFHLVIPYYRNVIESHDFVTHIEDEIKSEIQNITIIVHMEPCSRVCGNNSGSCGLECKNYITAEEKDNKN